MIHFTPPLSGIPHICSLFLHGFQATMFFYFLFSMTASVFSSLNSKWLILCNPINISTPNTPYISLPSTLGSYVRIPTQHLLGIYKHLKLNVSHKILPKSPHPSTWNRYSLACSGPSLSVILGSSLSFIFNTKSTRSFR